MCNLLWVRFAEHSAVTTFQIKQLKIAGFQAQKAPEGRTIIINQIEKYSIVYQQ